MKTLIIIPAYNEEGNILNVIKSIKDLKGEYDYLVVNDASTDGTGKILDENNINHIDLISNLGVGGAVQAGYKYAYNNDYDFAVQLDGDGQHDPSYIEKFIDILKTGEYSIVIGARFIEKEGFQSTLARQLGIKFLASLISYICKQKITDPTSGFRMADRRAIELFERKYPTDYPEPEAIVYSHKQGLNIKEYPVVMRRRESGVSSISGLKSLYYMIKVTIAIMFAQRDKK